MRKCHKKYTNFIYDFDAKICAKLRKSDREGKMSQREKEKERKSRKTAHSQLRF